MRRRVTRRQHPKRHVLLQPPRDLARGKHPARIRIDQYLRHHHRVIRLVAPPVPFIPGVERRQIQLIDHLAHEIRQVVLRQPLRQGRRQQKLLIRLVRQKARRHQRFLRGTLRHYAEHSAVPAAQTPSANRSIRTGLVK